MCYMILYGCNGVIAQLGERLDGIQKARGSIPLNSTFQPTTADMRSLLNYYGQQKTPFFFIISYDTKSSFVLPLRMVNPDEIKYDFSGITNTKGKQKIKRDFSFDKKFIEYAKYKPMFDKINCEFKNGNTFLCNLTQPTELETDLTLDEIYYNAKSKYKISVKDKFTCFSPETFIKIRNNRIYTYPMKGTINASLPDAKRKLLNDQKEFAEHITVVDLLRNDIGIVAANVKVDRFRYVSKVKTDKGTVLQTSSIISGDLDCGWQKNIGDLIYTMLPAGSVTGAPKTKTVEIINSVEQYERGFYTGVAGYFDGENVDSCVLIRFIEKIADKMYYKSGGGLTIYSDCRSEYEELKEKVYVPF